MLAIRIAPLVLLVALVPQNPAISEPVALQPCEMGSRHPEAHSELEQFAFMVGNWDIKARRKLADGTWSKRFQPAYWEGRWALGGYAIADYWYDRPPTDGAAAQSGGVNLRMYHPQEGQWLNMWQHTMVPEVRTLTSEVREDGLMHMWASHPDTSDKRRMTFVVESDDFWYRVEENSQDGGKTWQEVTRLDAHRAPCPWVGPPEK